MLRKNDNTSDYFECYKNRKTIPKVQNIGKDHRDLIDKSLNSRSFAKYSSSKYTS